METNNNNAAQEAAQTQDFEPVDGNSTSTGKTVKQWVISHAVEIGIGTVSFLFGVLTGRATKKTKKED